MTNEIGFDTTEFSTNPHTIHLLHDKDKEYISNQDEPVSPAVPTTTLK